MYVPVWLMWLVALLVACMPIAMLLMSGMVRKVGSSSEECNTHEVSCEDMPDVSKFKEVLLLTYATVLAEYQMSQYWDKDIDRIY